MFNSLFPFATGVRQKKIYLENTNLFQHLKNFGYNIYGIIPKATNLSPIHNFFKNKDVTFDALSPTAYVTSSLGERIIDMVKKHRMEMPWFYYVHIFDLHPPFNVHKNFQNEKIRENYILKDLLFLRDDVDDVISRMEHPDIVGFSNYIWNTNYNRSLALAIKRRWPDTLIIFGGPEVPDNVDTFYEKNPVKYRL